MNTNKETNFPGLRAEIANLEKQLKETNDVLRTGAAYTEVCDGDRSSQVINNDILTRKRIIEKELDKKRAELSKLLSEPEKHTHFGKIYSVKITNQKGETESKKYQIVSGNPGSKNSDGSFRISDKNPIGKALISAEVGQSVKVTVPAGVFLITILDIKTTETPIEHE